MVARARSAEATGERILDAAVELFWEQLSDQTTLNDVAARAGVTVQTVIRRFGTKERLLAAAVEREVSRVKAQRNLATPGDVPRAVANLIEHYETTGDKALRLLAEEGRADAVKEPIEVGRAYHRQWCERVFEPYLRNLSGADRKRRLAQLVAICDVYTWKLLRRDQRLGRKQTERAIAEMLAPFTTNLFTTEES
jgi:AcrR family transcriptional regulator